MGVTCSRVYTSLFTSQFRDMVSSSYKKLCVIYMLSTRVTCLIEQSSYQVSSQQLSSHPNTCIFALHGLDTQPAQYRPDTNTSWLLSILALIQYN